MFNELDIDKQYRFPPDWSQCILDWAKPRFESVFILLHPFIALKEDQRKLIEPESLLQYDPYDLIMSGDVKHVAWSDILTKLSISSYERLNRILSDLMIDSVNGPMFPDEMLRLHSYMLEEYVLPPTSHHLAPSLKPRIKQSIEKFGKGNPLWGGKTVDESPFERKNLLYGTPYEQFFSLICSSQGALKQIVELYEFEGFYADDNTKFDWSEGAHHEVGFGTETILYRDDPVEKERLLKESEDRFHNHLGELIEERFSHMELEFKGSCKLEFQFWFPNKDCAEWMSKELTDDGFECDFSLPFNSKEWALVAIKKIELDVQVLNELGKRLTHQALKFDGLFHHWNLGESPEDV